VSQVLRRARWRAPNSGLRIDAACLTAEIIAGPISLAVRVSRDVNSARTIAAGRGMMLYGECTYTTSGGCGQRWGPPGDHTSCAMPNDLYVRERHTPRPGHGNLR
jgi:hypothetical protein